MSDPIAGPVGNAPPLPDAPFVFFTVGTDHHPFDRLVSLADGWSRTTGVDCFVQYGTSAAPARVQGAAYLPYGAMVEAMETAAAVVCHGGPATIMLARQCGRVPIVVARDPDRGEHVDGHQMEFAAWMGDKQQVMLAESETDLAGRLTLAQEDPERFRVDPSDDATAASVARFTELVNALLEEKGR